MKISYGVTVCKEREEIKILLPFLIKNKRPEDEIVVLQDTRDFDDTAKEILEYCRELGVVHLHDSFNNDFAAWKNKLNSFCMGDWIVQLDADECPNENFMKYLPAVLEENPNLDLILVSRHNTVEGVTEEDIKNWGWVVTPSSSGKHLINWPDWQTRIYKNGLNWKGKVHERIEGFVEYAKLPTGLYLNHAKTIEKQRQQNQLYTKLLKNG